MRCDRKLKLHLHEVEVEYADRCLKTGFKRQYGRYVYRGEACTFFGQHKVPCMPHPADEALVRIISWVN